MEALAVYKSCTSDMHKVFNIKGYQIFLCDKQLQVRSATLLGEFYKALYVNTLRLCLEAFYIKVFSHYY